LRRKKHIMLICYIFVIFPLISLGHGSIHTHAGRQKEFICKEILLPEITKSIVKNISGVMFEISLQVFTDTQCLFFYIFFVTCKLFVSDIFNLKTVIC
jgi:cytochrome bd-type quinol oxidase subunit 1